MNKLTVVIAAIFFWQNSIVAQAIPSIKLNTLNGEVFNTEKFTTNSSKPIVLSFWATWCIPCLNELTAFNDNMEDWQNEIKFQLYAISQDDSRTVKNVPALVNGKGWKFDVLLDKNQDLKRELNILNIPHTIIIKNGKIIYRRNGYTPGFENEIYKILKANQ